MLQKINAFADRVEKKLFAKKFLGIAHYWWAFGVAVILVVVVSFIYFTRIAV